MLAVPSPAAPRTETTASAPPGPSNFASPIEGSLLLGLYDQPSELA